MSLPLRTRVADPDLLLGLVEVHGVPSGPASPALDAEIEAALATFANAGAAPPPAHEPVRAAIRDLLRRGGHRPAGRGKPASEYLAQAASRGEFPRISHVVDAANLTSLESALPISLLDLTRAAAAGPELIVRFGEPDERYVFNAAGHEIELAGLLCVAAARAGGTSVPLGTPVKDSMATKTTADTRDVLATVWASRRAVSEADLQQLLERLAHRLAAERTTVRIVPRPPS